MAAAKAGGGAAAVEFQLRGLNAQSSLNSRRVKYMDFGERRGMRSGQCATYYFSLLPSAAFLKTSTHISKYSTETGFLQEGRKEKSSQ